MLLAACSTPRNTPLAPRLDTSPPPDSAFAGLPAPDQLPRAVSSATKFNGADAVVTVHCGLDDTNLLLRPPDAEAATRLTYAIYVFEGLEQIPPAVVSSTGSNEQSQIWVALADWQAQRWRFVPGFFMTHPGAVLAELGGNPNRFVSEDGRLAIAYVLHECPATVNLRSVELAVPPPVENLAATTNRWDSVRLSWDADDKSEGYRVYRRVADSLGGFELLTDEPLERYDTQFEDFKAFSLAQYEYRVASSRHYQIRGIGHTFWNSGVSTIGYRRQAELDIEDSVAMHWPANLSNYLSFFYVTAGQEDEPSIARATTYPPGEGWDIEHSGDNNFGLFDLAGQPNMGTVPFVCQQGSEVNNALITVGYSNALGAFVQVGTVATDGTLDWEEAVELRDAPQTHMLGFARHGAVLLAFKWNEATQRIETMLSQDGAGRSWFEYDPDSWMNITSRRPEGGIQASSLWSVMSVCFRESGSSQAVVIQDSPEEWQDISPGIAVRGQPQMHTGRVNIFEAVTALFHIPADGSSIVCLPRKGGAWLTGQERVIGSSVGGGITELSMYAQPEGSTNSYVAWAEDGNVWFSHGTDQAFLDWSEPQLIDDTGVCSDLRVLFVGTDPEWLTNYVFVAYLRTLEDGTRQLTYRDMQSLLPD